MSQNVKLYVYDLSNGLARSMSRQFLGRQIDGIWHTSVVVFGKEYFYGQGILTTQPGRSHHGQPLRIEDMGETAIDQEIFNEYLAEMRGHYTADKYHLLEFNCNSFTNDVVGFLTGNSIPDYIKDLPSDFLSSPFGAALRPTIDAMFRRPVSAAPTPPAPVPSTPPVAATPTSTQAESQQLAANLLQALALQAGRSTTSPPAAPTPTSQAQSQALTSPLHLITNTASFQSFVRTHKAAAAFFTSQTCPPCRMIEPVFERMAEEKGPKMIGGPGVGFAKIDIGVGAAQALAREWNISATPTFIFFLNGNKVDEMKGADANELRTQVDLLMFQAYPPHPHTSLSLPAIQALSLNPILFTQVPPIDTIVSKLSSFIDSVTPWPSGIQTQAQVKSILTGSIAPYLKARFPPAARGATSPKPGPSATPALLTSWSQATQALVKALPPTQLFPLVDMLRLGFLDPAVGTFANPSSKTDPISLILDIAMEALSGPEAAGSPTNTDAKEKATRNLLLTSLRMLANTFSSPVLARRMYAERRETLTVILVGSLLHPDGGVRTASASLVFNLVGVVQACRVSKVRSGGIGSSGGGGGQLTGTAAGREGQIGEVQEDEDWQIETLSAIVEALDREEGSEEVVHRLTASLAFLLRLSPQYEMGLKPLLDVLQAKQVLERKAKQGELLKKGEVKKLVEEVGSKLCP